MTKKNLMEAISDRISSGTLEHDTLDVMTAAAVQPNTKLRTIIIITDSGSSGKNFKTRRTTLSEYTSKKMRTIKAFFLNTSTSITH